LLRCGSGAVVLAEPLDEPGGQGLDEHTFGDLGWGQDEDAVTAVLAVALGPRDGGCAKSLLCSIKTLPHHHLVREGPAPVPEPLHVNGDDRPVHCER
jgi:hypothetical protein